MALLNTWASQQDPNSLSPLDRALNNYIQQGDAPLAYLPLTRLIKRLVMS